MPDLAATRDQLLTTLRSYESCVVALSAGVDSSVVARAAHLALGDRALAVTGSSASLAAGELDEARTLAAQIGIAHRVLETQEFARPGYIQNAPDRCYHCKTELYEQLERVRAEIGFATIVNGANKDDLGDYRPGMQAAAEHRIRSPLLECGIDKAMVRALAAEWNLPLWDKPATPCLSSRVAYGQSVTPERLRMIDAVEQWLRRECNFRIVRVRYHKGDLARVEVPREDLDRLLEPALREELTQRALNAGFKFVTIDLAGFRSGSHNEVLGKTLLPLL